MWGYQYHAYAGAAESAAEPEWDDFDAEVALEEEEETLVLGGQGFLPEELAAAERHLEQSQVRTSPQSYCQHVAKTCGYEVRFSWFSCHQC